MITPIDVNIEKRRGMVSFGHPGTGMGTITQPESMVKIGISPGELTLDGLVLALSKGGRLHFDLTFQLCVPGAPQEIELGVSGIGAPRIIRELAQDPADIASIGEVEVDFRKLEMRRGSRRIPLTPGEVKILRYLLSHPDEAISRSELLDKVWGYQSYPSTRTVDNRIMKLRKKLESNPSRPVHLITVQGWGYKFVPFP
jgi:hypothetical protein